MAKVGRDVVNLGGFDSCWRRIDRAAEHQREAAEAWNAFLDHEPYDLSLTQIAGGTWAMRVHQTVDLPAELPILIGEWAYNLRAALDYAVYETAVIACGKRPPTSASSLQFPIYDSKDAFDKKRSQLRALAPHHIDMLERMQPYRREDPDTSALRWLNRIAREDRHRELSVLTAYAAELNPWVKVPDGCQVDVTFGERTLVSGAAELFRLTVTPWTDGMEVAANPNVGLDMDIEGWTRSAFWSVIPYNKRIWLVASLPTTTVAAFEYDCFGQSRRSDLLAQPFKDECDRRRRTWKQWT